MKELILNYLIIASFLSIIMWVADFIIRVKMALRHICFTCVLSSFALLIPNFGMVVSFLLMYLLVVKLSSAKAFPDGFFLAGVTQIAYHLFKHYLYLDSFLYK